MKLNKLVMLALVSLFTFASCQDEKKDKENEIEMNENEMDANETSMEAEKEAEKTEMNLAQITMNSNKHTTLVSAVQGAGMVAKLESEGPFTIFAPTNEAFNKLPKGTVESLMKPESKEKLEGVLSYHIIPGEVDSKKLVDLINSNENKKYTIVTANDGKIDATIEDGKVMLTDAKGNKATVTDVDMKGSNGYVHSIDAVLMRK
ncbi:putative surface protein with fasciclin (FAS1) repeats [Mesonia algae]|uniref:Putative surface protein with fasciclin (FAS1) repeats n=1 Tax=Mesonia algae TaxID=213248 RepID=A0A2W7HWY6_9FLAO|nr:fasciclin domain-containing protein [Mesonia algae]PZW37885.1 putative surface protein with fasciclin (FAS1) repeats [Mesonia algae]